MDDFKRYSLRFEIDNFKLDRMYIGLQPWDFLANEMLIYLRHWVNEHAITRKGEDLTEYELTFDIRPVLRKKEDAQP